MPTTPRHPSIDTGWQQLEKFVDQLHQLTRKPIARADFYRQLLDGSVSTLAAVGGAIWLPAAQGGMELCYHINFDQLIEPEDSIAQTAHQELLQFARGSDAPQLIPPRSGSKEAIKNPTDAVLLLGAVPAKAGGMPPIIVELFMRSGSSPATERGWQEYLDTICHVAADFHTFDELRALQAEHGLHKQSLELLRRIHRSPDLKQTAFEIANEGRRFVDGDRLSVVRRHGKKWQLVSASGVDRVDARGDTTRQLEQLATRIASWDEPLDYNGMVSGELPSELTELLEHYIDHSQARRIVAVPLTLNTMERDSSHTRQKHRLPEWVLIAELFSTQSKEFSCQRVVELAALCEPALRQSTWLDRFPLRTTLRWADRWDRWTKSWGLTRRRFIAGAVVALILALIGVQTDFEIEAPATLVPTVERDVFASTNGTLQKVEVQHGIEVQEGDVLAVLEDLGLDLEFERVQGEIATVRKRLEAIAVARTDRQAREEEPTGRLPLSAEAQQLEKQLASLLKQHEILKTQQDALILRSPIAGKIITLDAQNLLRARPVERGQVLFTVANISAGWQLKVDVSQDCIGHVLEAQRKTQPAKLPVRFRLMGEIDQTFHGYLESVSATTVHADRDLESDPRAVQAIVHVDEERLPAARPGMSAQVRFSCGRRSLGYVWLHDIWNTVYSWWVF